MAEINAKLVKQLRDATRAPMMDCKKALTETGGDVEKAKDWLRKKQIVKASDMSDRASAEGRVFSYVHHNKKIGVLLEATCETDFVAASADFTALFQDICLHIAAKPDCKYLDRESVPAAVLEREMDILREEVKKLPADKQEMVLKGKVEKQFFQRFVVLEQPFIKDESKAVKDAILEKAGLLQENIQIKRFARYEIGLGG